MSDYPIMMRDLVLIKHPKKIKSVGGIQLPESVINDEKLKASDGTAMACGSECKEVKEGDRVIWKAYVGNNIDDELFDNKYWYTIVAEEDILCYYKKTK